LPGHKEKAGLSGARRGKAAAALDAAGAALGSFGLAAFALVIWLMIEGSAALALDGSLVSPDRLATAFAAGGVDVDRPVVTKVDAEEERLAKRLRPAQWAVRSEGLASRRPCDRIESPDKGGLNDLLDSLASFLRSRHYR
jgi:hypothetical protein